MRTSIIIPVTVLVATLAASCGGSANAAPVGEAKVELTDYAISMPATIAGPVIDLDIANVGAFAHELDLAQVPPGTTLEQVQQQFGEGREGAFEIIADPGGVPALAAGASLDYARTLAPGTYVFFCSFPAPDGESHAAHGMYALFTVTDDGPTDLPAAELVVALGDDAITLPTLEAGANVVAVKNTGTVPHDLSIAGVPAGTDLSRGAEVSAWMEGGQNGPAPLPVAFAGGIQSIDPGVTVVLTITLKAAHTYMFSDNTGDEEIMALVDIP